MIVDASALIEWVLRSPVGAVVARQLEEHEGATYAPNLIVIETANTLRRMEVRELIDRRRAGTRPRSRSQPDTHKGWPVQMRSRLRLRRRVTTKRTSSTAMTTYTTPFSQSLYAPMSCQRSPST